MPPARSQAFSLGLHVLIALLLLVAAQAVRAPSQPTTPIRATRLTFYRRRTLAEPRGGGSNQTAVPAKHGSPPPIARRTLIPPLFPPKPSDHPPLALPITIAFDIPLDNISANTGDPLSHLAESMFGGNGRNGIGDRGCCQGIGDSTYGPPGLSAHRGRRAVTPPQLVHKVEPEFSEEARNAKYQGVVVLTIEVDSSGSVRNVQVRQGLGLGLDEKAIEAVSHWRFRPAIQDGKPVTTEAVVQVNFQLL